MAFALMTTKNTFTVGDGIIGIADNSGTCSVSRNTAEKFFYSNNPENLKNGYSLADDGYWLARELISGTGHLYTWHINNTGKTIHSNILLYNPGSTNVTITFSNIGLTNGANSDRNAWINYYNNTSGNKIFTLKPQQFLSPDVLQSTVTNGKMFGKIARFSISGGNLYIYDLAYATNSGGATAPAPKDESISRTRGLGQGFYETMNVILTLTDNAATQSFSLGGINGAANNKNDSFNGNDLISIKDSSPSPNLSHYLYGNYGVQMRINLTIDNQCKVGNNGKKVRIFMGTWVSAENNGGFVPFCRYDKKFYSAITGNAGARTYVDVLYNDAMPTGKSTVTFAMIVPAAISTAPVIVGARWV